MRITSTRPCPLWTVQLVLVLVLVRTRTVSPLSYHCIGSFHTISTTAAAAFTSTTPANPLPHARIHTHAYPAPPAQIYSEAEEEGAPRRRQQQQQPPVPSSRIPKVVDQVALEVEKSFNNFLEKYLVAALVEVR